MIQFGIFWSKYLLTALKKEQLKTCCLVLWCSLSACKLLSVLHELLLLSQKPTRCCEAALPYRDTLWFPWCAAAHWNSPASGTSQNLQFLHHQEDWRCSAKYFEARIENIAFLINKTQPEKKAQCAKWHFSFYYAILIAKCYSKIFNLYPFNHILISFNLLFLLILSTYLTNDFDEHNKLKIKC